MHARRSSGSGSARRSRDGEILVYGDGSQRRDLTYVDDAVAAFLLAGATDRAMGNVYNLGGDGHVSLLELAEMVVELAGAGHVQLIPFPERSEGDRHRRFLRRTTPTSGQDLGWEPTTPLRDWPCEDARLLPGERASATGTTTSDESPSSTSAAGPVTTSEAALARVLDRGQFILSDEVAQFRGGVRRLLRHAARRRRGVWNRRDHRRTPRGRDPARQTR